MSENNITNVLSSVYPLRTVHVHWCNKYSNLLLSRVLNFILFKVDEKSELVIKLTHTFVTERTNKAEKISHFNSKYDPSNGWSKVMWRLSTQVELVIVMWRLSAPQVELVISRTGAINFGSWSLPSDEMNIEVIYDHGRIELRSHQSYLTNVVSKS